MVGIVVNCVNMRLKAYVLRKSRCKNRLAEYRSFFVRRCLVRVCLVIAKFELRAASLQLSLFSLGDISYIPVRILGCRDDVCRLSGFAMAEQRVFLWFETFLHVRRFCLFVCLFVFFLLNCKETELQRKRAHEKPTPTISPTVGISEKGI